MIRRNLFIGILLVGLVLAICGSWLTSSSQCLNIDDTTTVISDITYWPEIPNIPKNRTQIGVEKGTMYMLVRNFEVQEALESIRKVEDRFNRRYRYPWVFLNDEEFTEDFRLLTSGMVSGDAHYGFIEPEVWNVPSHINKTKMDECIEEMTRNDVIYGGSRSYRNMCRFNSGNFFWHPLMMPYDYYWRVEPGVDFYCDQRYDPFTFMRENDKVYGFVITFPEVKETIETLFNTFTEFLRKFPEYIASNNGLAFVTDKSTLKPWITDETMEANSLNGYNLCHFWSNFEIGSLQFFRSEAYTAYFDYLDKAGGFYYERWGDAPVHSLGVLALANISQIHHFSDIGYYHAPFYRCPHDDASFISGRCLCPPNKGDSIDFQDWSCLPRWLKHAGKDLMFHMDPNTALFE